MVANNRYSRIKPDASVKVTRGHSSERARGVDIFKLLSILVLLNTDVIECVETPNVCHIIHVLI